MLTAPLHIGLVTLQFFEQATPFKLEHIWSHPDFSLLYYGTRYGVSSSNEFISFEGITPTNRSLLNVWHCVNQFVTDYATIHILVHVCGQMWTFKHCYDSINILLVI